MLGISTILDQIEALLKESDNSHLVVDHPNFYKSHTKPNSLDKKAPLLKLTPPFLASKSTTKKPTEKKELPQKKVEPEESYFKDIIQKIDRNFVFVEKTLSSSDADALHTITNSSSKITLLCLTQKEKKRLDPILSKIQELSTNVEILFIEASLNEMLLKHLFTQTKIKLFIAFDTILENSALKPHLKIFKGKILKKLDKTPLLTIDSNDCFETIKMCIERLKL